MAGETLYLTEEQAIVAATTEPHERYEVWENPQIHTYCYTKYNEMPVAFVGAWGISAKVCEVIWIEPSEDEPDSATGWFIFGYSPKNKGWLYLVANVRGLVRTDIATRKP